MAAAAISVAELAAQAGRLDLGLIDVRETAEYNLAHVPGSCSLPRRLIEARIADLVPWRGTPIVLCDDDGRRAALAADTLAAMGYTDVSVLAGGLNRWVTEGHETEWGVNVPSKDFGEKVLLTRPVPEITPDGLRELQDRGEKLIILDSRTPEEHSRACIPGSRSLPGAELALRVPSLLEDPDARVVVHCAGRTRSIIGAATLLKMGLRNVVALRNGTMGWQLAGHELETGSRRLDLPPPADTPEVEARARAVVMEAGARYSGLDELQAVGARAATENVYRLDVRSREEYAAGHIPGFRWAPGGQLVQATDSYIAVKGSTVVLACDGVVRASLTASWLAEMGFPEVYVLDGGTKAWQAAGRDLETGAGAAPPFGYEAAKSRVTSVTAATLAERVRGPDAPVVLFVGTSEEFSEAHVPGSAWLSRSWLELRLDEAAPDRSRPVAVTCADGVWSTLAAATLLDLGYADVARLEGGVNAWRAAGYEVEAGLTGVRKAPDDVLPATRTYAEMLNYLRWEEELGRKYAAR